MNETLFEAVWTISAISELYAQLAATETNGQIP